MFEARFQSFEDRTERAASAPRVAALRTELARRGLTGFIVPRADRHQNEYVPASEERLAWLTGFTGSAGAAIVLDGPGGAVRRRPLHPAGARAGRYLRCSPSSIWSRRRPTAGSRRISPRARPPRLRSLAAHRRRRRAAGQGLRRGRRHAWSRSSPTRSTRSGPTVPPRRSAPVTLHDLRFAGEAAEDKLARIRAELAKLRADALVVSDPHAVAWAFNIRGADVAHTPLPLAFAIVPQRGRPALYVDGRKLSNDVRDRLEDARRRARAGRFRARRWQRSAQARSTVRLDQATAADALARLVTSHGGKVARGADPIALMKAVKNAVEIAGARAAHLRDGAAVARFLAWFDREAPRGTLTEIDAVEALESFRRDTGLLKDVSFPTIAGAGPDGAIVHYRVTTQDQPADRARRAVPDRFRRPVRGRHHRHHPHRRGRRRRPTRCATRFTRVLKGHIAIARAVFPDGTTGAQLDSFARQFLWEAGLDFDHGTGHGVGSYLSVHEGPARISKLGTTRAQARHDPVERARLLQGRRLRHPHRESGAGGRGRRRSPAREKAAQRLRDAHAGADRPPADRCRAC